VVGVEVVEVAGTGRHGHDSLACATYHEFRRSADGRTVCVPSEFELASSDRCWCWCWYLEDLENFHMQEHVHVFVGCIPLTTQHCRRRWKVEDGGHDAVPLDRHLQGSTCTCLPRWSRCPALATWRYSSSYIRHAFPAYLS